jgi:hypothetical protein
MAKYDPLFDYLSAQNRGCGSHLPRSSESSATRSPHPLVATRHGGQTSATEPMPTHGLGWTSHTRRSSSTSTERPSSSSDPPAELEPDRSGTRETQVWTLRWCSCSHSGSLSSRCSSDRTSGTRRTSGNRCGTTSSVSRTGSLPNHTPAARRPNTRHSMSSAGDAGRQSRPPAGSKFRRRQV